MRSSPLQTLLMRQQCHDLHAQGKTQRQIQAALNIARATVRDWLSRPRPTDEELAELPANKTDITGQVPLKMRFPPDLMAAMKAEAEAQGGAPLNKLIGCSLRLYLDCMERARTGIQEPVHILGYRA